MLPQKKKETTGYDELRKIETAVGAKYEIKIPYKPNTLFYKVKKDIEKAPVEGDEIIHKEDDEKDVVSNPDECRDGEFPV